MAECVECGGPMSPRPLGTRGRPPIVCSAECRASRARSTSRTEAQRAASATRMRQLRRADRAGRGPKTLQDPPRADGLCVECGEHPARRRFYSKACSGRASRRRDASRVTAANRALGATKPCARCRVEFVGTRLDRRRYCSAICRADAADAAKPDALPPRGCPVCEKEFQPAKRTQQTCSTQCARRAWRVAHPEVDAERRARKRGATVVESVNRVAVFERDRWRCHLCAKPIDKRAKFPHPNSASLDHILPLARKGEHTMANVAAAHLRCNLSKNARGSGEQLAMI